MLTAIHAKAVAIARGSAISIVFFLLSFTDLSNAQLLKSYGVKVAFTSSSQHLAEPFPSPGWWNSSTMSSKPGYNIAAFAEWFNFPYLSFVSQIEYDQRGARLNYYILTAPPLGTASTNGRLDYLSVPIMAKFTFRTVPLNPYLMAGPRVDFLTGHDDAEIQPDMYPLYSNFRKTMFGWSMGVGLETDSLLPFSLSAELRYNFDFFAAYANGNIAIYNDALDIWLGVAL